MGLQVTLSIDKKESELLNQLAEEIREYADKEGLPPEKVAYDLTEAGHIHSMTKEANKVYDDLIKHQLLKQFKQLCGESARDYKAGDVYVLKDAFEVHDYIENELYTRVDSDG